MKPSIVIPLWLSEADIQPNSKRIYEFAIRNYFIWLSAKKKDPGNTSKADILQYKTHLQEQNLKPSTQRLYFSVIGIFYEWAEMNNLHSDVTQGIKPPKYSHDYKRYPLNQEEVLSLLHTCNRSTIKGIRDFAILFLLLNNGLRRNELRNISLEDIKSINGKKIIKILGKGHTKKDDWVELTDETSFHLQTWIKLLPDPLPPDPLFPAIAGKTVTKRRISNDWLSHMIQGKLKLIGLDSEFYSCHSLRHTFACMILEEGFDIGQAQSHLRHKSPNVTQAYTRIQQEKLKAENKVGKAISAKISKLLENAR